RLLRANGKIHIGTLKASNIKASNVRLEIKAAGGQVSVSPLSANLYGGAMNGAASVNAAPATPQFAIKQNLNGVSIGPLLKDLADKDMLEGKGTVNVDVRTQGATVGALKRALNGGASVNLRDGSIKGIDIAGTIRDARAQLAAMKGQQTQQADKNKKTEFSELSGTFAIQNGVARNNDLSLKSPLLRVAGAGDINIGEDTVNYLVKASVVGTLSGQDGRGVNDLRGVTVPVRATGPLAAPSFALDFESLVTDTVKQKAEDAVKSKIEERLFGKKSAAPAAPSATPAPAGRDAAKDVLKGIFGR
ncbi:MAG TPA: AsmA family protein, partial [Burkholderiales bacterium]|nr:AsmA family protein [Burkholderiales bacterium]